MTADGQSHILTWKNLSQTVPSACRIFAEKDQGYGTDDTTRRCAGGNGNQGDG